MFMGIKKVEWVDFYHYRVVVYTLVLKYFQAPFKSEFCMIGPLLNLLAVTSHSNGYVSEFSLNFEGFFTILIQKS